MPPLTAGKFGGMATSVQFEPGRLAKCSNCKLWFRSPAPSAEQLIALYDALPDTIWSQAEPRHYWPILLDFMNQYSSNEIVLDVGCYNGDFLDWLPTNWQKYGIEPSRRAAATAGKRGINVLGATLEECLEPSDAPGCATVLDVIEHVVSPMPFLRSLRERLAPSGAIIIMTGATDSFAFRLFGRHYWYSSLPEHMTFYSIRWFDWAARKLGMRLVDYRYLSSEPRDDGRSLREAGQIALYTLVRSLKQRKVSEAAISRLPYGRLALTWTAVPWWKHASDHIIVVLKTG